MKFVLLITFLASAAYMTSAKKLLVVGGLNGGLVPGLNGGLLGQGLVVGGVNPALLPAGAVIGQSPFAQVLPGVSPYFMQPPVAAAPFGMPFAQPQVPQQAPFPANGGLPYFAPPNRQVLPPQQQAAGMMNPMGNGQQPQGDMPAGPGARFRRSLYRRLQDKSVNCNPQVTPTPTAENPAK